MTKRVLAAGLVTLLAFCLLVALGVWQMHRLTWKEGLLAQITSGLSKPPTDFQSTMTSNSLQMPEFMHVSLDGSVVSPPLFLYGRTLDGTAGVHVLCLVQTTGGHRVGPLHVLLDRGFIPLPIDQAKANTAITMPVDGLLRYTPSEGLFDPPNDAAKNQWFRIDPVAMGKAAGVADVDTIYVEALKPTSADGPVPTAGHLVDNIPNNHFQYALTWFGLAAALVFVYGAWVWQQVKERKA